MNNPLVELLAQNNSSKLIQTNASSYQLIENTLLRLNLYNQFFYPLYYLVKILILSN